MSPVINLAGDVIPGDPRDFDGMTSYPSQRPEDWIFRDGRAAMLRETAIPLSWMELKSLPNYSASVPTGVDIGKCWRCAYIYSEQRDTDRWALRFYHDIGDPDKVGIGTVPIHLETARETQIRVFDRLLRCLPPGTQVPRVYIPAWHESYLEP